SLLHREPAQRVHLFARLELTLDRPHQPVAHDLVPSLPVDVRSAARGPDDLAAQARLLFHLPQRSLLGCLAIVQLALRQRPVVLDWPVDDRHLGQAVSARPPDHATGGTDSVGVGAPPGRGHSPHAAAVGLSQARVLARSRRAHAAGQRPRASAALATSSAHSSPATKARRRDVTAFRSQAWAVMLSWCSPSSVWSAAASLAKRAASGPTAGDTASDAYRSLFARMRTWCSSSSDGFSGSWPAARRRSRHGLSASAGRTCPAGVPIRSGWVSSNPG